MRNTKSLLSFSSLEVLLCFIDLTLIFNSDSTKEGDPTFRLFFTTSLKGDSHLRTLLFFNMFTGNHVSSLLVAIPNNKELKSFRPMLITRRLFIQQRSALPIYIKVIAIRYVKTSTKINKNKNSPLQAVSLIDSSGGSYLTFNPFNPDL